LYYVCNDLSSARTNVRLTHEQLRICNHNVQQGQLIKIIAFAGDLFYLTYFIHILLSVGLHLKYTRNSMLFTYRCFVILL